MTPESSTAVDSTVTAEGTRTADGSADGTAAQRRMPAPPPFPAFQTPGTPEEVSGHSLVHR